MNNREIRNLLRQACFLTPRQLSWQGLVYDYEMRDENRMPHGVRFEPPIERLQDALLTLPEREAFHRRVIII